MLVLNSRLKKISMEENKVLSSNEYSAVCKEFRSRFKEAKRLFEIIEIERVDSPGFLFSQPNNQSNSVVYFFSNNSSKA